MSRGAGSGATALVPEAGPAPWVSMVLSQAVFEVRTVLRHGEQLLITAILPALFLVVLARTDVFTLPLGDGQERIDLIAPGVLALAVLSSAFTGPAISTGFDRRAGALRLLATTPLGRSGLLAGKVLGVGFVQVLQVALLASLAVVLGWRPPLAGALLGVLPFAAGTAAFTALAMLVAGTLRTEAVLAGANLLWVLLAIGGGVLLPTGARWLPSAALGDGLRAAMQVQVGTVAICTAILIGWTVVLTAAAVRWFRWH